MIQDFDLKLTYITDQLNAISDMVLSLHDEIRDEYEDLSESEKLTDHARELLLVRDLLFSRYFDLTGQCSCLQAMEEHFCEKGI